jgi:hypothetical protein
VTVTRRYRTFRAGNRSVTALPPAGSKVCRAGPVRVRNDRPSAEPLTDSACVRVFHSSSGGSRSTSRPTRDARPRSTVTVAGNVLAGPSQYERVLPSVTVPPE